MRALPPAARRSLSVICALFVAAAVAGIAAGPVSAHPVTGSDANGTYLALGDSVAFGYVPPTAVSGTPDYFDPSSFVGYPEDLANMLGEPVSNASCPGETTVSFFDLGALSNGCENLLGTSSFSYRRLYPLHVSYHGNQLSYALDYLTKHPNTNLITIDIGANDLFVCQGITSDGCSSQAELEGVLNQVETNLAKDLHKLRDVAGYQVPIVVLTYYSLSYSYTPYVMLTQALDYAITEAANANGAIVADGYGAFKTATASTPNSNGEPCTAGLLIPVTSGGTAPPDCNIHPTALGQQLLADAIYNVLPTT